MKSKEEIEQLKNDWVNDPCWDIEDTEGYEEHKEELKAFSEAMHAKWIKRAEERKRAEMEKMGVTDERTYNYLKGLERDMEDLRKNLNELNASGDN